MIPSTQLADFDIPYVCHAEVDLPAWLAHMTGKGGWRLQSENDMEDCDTYQFRLGEGWAIVSLFHTGYATVEVDGEMLFDGSLLAVPSHTTLHYFHAESGEPITVH